MPINTLKAIATTAKLIYKQVQLARRNEDDCKKLEERIKGVIAATEKLNLGTNRDCKGVLDLFQSCLNETLSFIKQFSKEAGCFESLFYAGDSRKKFEEIEARLSKTMMDLTTGLVVLLVVEKKSEAENLKFCKTHCAEGQAYEENRRYREQIEKQDNLTLGYNYFEGKGVETNIKKGLLYLEKAAKIGSVTAMTNLASIYKYGHKGVMKNEAKALQWISSAKATKDAQIAKRKALLPPSKPVVNASNNVPYDPSLSSDKKRQRKKEEQQKNIGKTRSSMAVPAPLNASAVVSSCSSSSSISTPTPNAPENFSRHNETNPSVSAVLTIGAPILSSFVLNKSLAPVLNPAQGSCEAIEALVNLGLKALNDKNEVEAFESFKLAAEQQNAEAQFQLGYCYEAGIGTKENNEEAQVFYRRAAEQGHALAEFALKGPYRKLSKTQLKLSPPRLAQVNTVPIQPMVLESSAVASSTAPTSTATAAPMYAPIPTATFTPLATTTSMRVLPPAPASILAPTTTPKLSLDAEALEKIKNECLTQSVDALNKKLELMQQQIFKQVQVTLDQHTKSFECQIQGELSILASLQKEKMDAKTYEEKFSQLWIHLENRFREITTQSIEQELTAIKGKGYSVEQQILVLQYRVSQNAGLKDKVSEIEKKLLPLLEEYNERQQVLLEQRYILENLTLKTFYQRVQIKLNQIFTAYMAISSGQMNRSKDNVNILIQLIEAPLNLLTLNLSSIITGAIGALYDKKQAKAIAKKIEDNFTSLTNSEALVEKLSRILTQRYEFQIKLLTVPGQESLKDKLTIGKSANGGAETLADCAVARMLDALNMGVIKPNAFMAEQLVNSIFSSKKKQGSILWFTNQPVATTLKKNPGWNDEGVFQRSGIMIPADINNEQYYKGQQDEPCGRPDKYGYRLGTAQEVETLKLIKELNPSPFHNDNTAPSRAFNTALMNVAKNQKDDKGKLELLKKQHQIEMEKRAHQEKQLQEEREERIRQGKKIDELQRLSKNSTLKLKVDQIMELIALHKYEQTPKTSSSVPLVFSANGLNLAGAFASSNQGSGSVSVCSTGLSSTTSSSSSPSIGDPSILKNVIEESIAMAKAKGNIGPTQLAGWQLTNVAALGDCFYLAILKQFENNNHVFLASVPKGTEPHHSLRLRIQGENFQDKAWADASEIEKFCHEFQLSLAIVDTRHPNLGFYYHFWKNNQYQHGRELPSELVGTKIIRLAFTGDHYLSVDQYPQSATHENATAKPATVSSKQ